MLKNNILLSYFVFIKFFPEAIRFENIMICSKWTKCVIIKKITRFFINFPHDLVEKLLLFINRKINIGIIYIRLNNAFDLYGITTILYKVSIVNLSAVF